MGASCGDTPTSPSGPATVTFGVGTETFSVLLTSSEQIAAAEAAKAGGPASIPVGRLLPGTDVNAGWSWHLENVTFAEVAIELCDGRPSDVERLGTQFANGQYCPWSARVLAIRTGDQD
jgi:hypothetical protein